MSHKLALELKLLFNGIGSTSPLSVESNVCDHQKFCLPIPETLAPLTESGPGPSGLEHGARGVRIAPPIWMKALWLHQWIGLLTAATSMREVDDLGFPDRAGWYAGEPVPTPVSTLTVEEQLDLLDSHPLFTGCCPQCGWEWDRSNLPAVHWDCPECGWKDDSV